VIPGNAIVVAHGNGPQVGLLALQSAAYTDVAPYPLDVLGAQTEAMIGYVIEQELGNLLPGEQPFATLLTMIEVDRDDPAFSHPTKPIGPIYERHTAERLAAVSGWTVAADGDKFRRRRSRSCPAPAGCGSAGSRRSASAWGWPRCGGIPTMYDEHGKLHGVEAVIDKDLASALLAEQLDADLLVIASDVDGVYTGWGTPEQAPAGPGHSRRAHRSGSPGGVDGSQGPGSMRLRAQHRQRSRHRIARRHRRHRCRHGGHPGARELVGTVMSSLAVRSNHVLNFLAREHLRVDVPKAGRARQLRERTEVFKVTAKLIVANMLAHRRRSGHNCRR
jgi:carbamate kinase